VLNAVHLLLLAELALLTGLLVCESLRLRLALEVFLHAHERLLAQLVARAGADLRKTLTGAFKRAAGSKC
jgi:hypothetical protein